MNKKIWIVLIILGTLVVGVLAFLLFGDLGHSNNFDKEHFENFDKGNFSGSPPPDLDESEFGEIGMPPEGNMTPPEGMGEFER